MTWGEFKTAVDDLLHKAESDSTVKLDMIRYKDHRGPVEIWIEPHERILTVHNAP